MLVATWVWAATLVAILALLAVDMLAHRGGADSVDSRQSLLWSVAWIALGTGFGFVVWAAWGAEYAGEYFGGYLLEKSLSVDNIAVFALIFAEFAVPKAYQHRVLFFGVLGALVMRAALIAVGATLISQFQWTLYVFGAFLLITAWRMLRERGRSRWGGLVQRMLPVTSGYHGQRFWVRRAGRVMATPMFVVLMLIEISDLIFAVDSIPTIFSITDEPFVVFTSNAFAILGLRALYLLLAGLLPRFTYLKPALAVILAFVGLKMLLSSVLHIPVTVSLGFIATCLAVAIWASVRARVRARRGRRTGRHTADRDTLSIWLKSGG